MIGWPVVVMRQDASKHSIATLQGSRRQPSGRSCQRQQSKRAPAEAPPASLLLLVLLASLLGCDARAAKPAQAEERLIGEHAADFLKLAMHMPRTPALPPEADLWKATQVLGNCMNRRVEGRIVQGAATAEVHDAVVDPAHLPRN